ncbi:MAG: hypothetical protein ACRCYY_05740 [Trueperaceae bacterium]
MLKEINTKEMQDINGGGIGTTAGVLYGAGMAIDDGISRIGEDKSALSNIVGCVEIGAAVVFGTAALVGVNILPTP